uniref:Uncharacterized protein n=1 Tax=Romanomermis culicivorax TaxID=13658 RepID=A0A915JDT4_ROMCU
MQQLISTKTAITARNYLPTPRPLLASSQFPCKDAHDIYIKNDTFRETDPTLAYAGPTQKRFLSTMAAPPALDFRTNSNDIRGQHDWRQEALAQEEPIILAVHDDIITK